MKVSIIIPIYNVSPYIERCLQSALNQTYEQIEYICVNDASTDDSFEKAKRIIASNSRQDQVVLVEHKKNEGIAIARNTGIEHSTGEYIYFLDSDDELPFNAIELLVTANAKYNADIVLGDFKVTGINRSLFPALSIPVGYIETNEEVFNSFISGKWPDMTCNKLERLANIRSHKMKFKEGILHEDSLWAFKLAMNSSSMVICHDLTYIYHIRPDSITRKKYDKNFESLIIVLNEIINHSSEQKLFNRYPLLIDYIADICIYFYKELLRSQMDKKYVTEKVTAIKELLKKIPKQIKRKSSILSKAKFFPYKVPSSIAYIYMKLILSAQNTLCNK